MKLKASAMLLVKSCDVEVTDDYCNVNKSSPFKARTNYANLVSRKKFLNIMHQKP